MDAENAERLCSELRCPVILIHADRKNNRTFWSAPQLECYERSVSAQRRAKQVTFRIPTQNELPATIEPLVRKITQIEQVLASRVLMTTPVIDYVASIDGHIDQVQSFFGERT